MTTIGVDGLDATEKLGEIARAGEFKKLGLVYKVALSATEPPVYFETVAASARWAVNLLRAFSVCSRIPEPIRVARLIVRELS